MPNSFRQKKIKLLDSIFVGGNLLSIMRLRGQINGNCDQLDNFISIKTDIGIVNAYCNGVNPIFNGEDDYIFYDCFNITENYEELHEEFLLIEKNQNIFSVDVAFSTKYNELFGFSILCNENVISVIFRTDEILLELNNTSDTFNFMNFLRAKMLHLEPGDIEVIKLN